SKLLPLRAIRLRPHAVENDIHAISFLLIARLLSRGRSYYIDIRGFSPNLFYYHVTPSGFSNFGLDLLLQSYHPFGVYVPL
ncbi:MAG TPA: hypothetical protein PK548_03215, partial [Bacteroidales bacterium]|nr:hypothetical protein [Bacteroidales bacterium]